MGIELKCRACENTEAIRGDTNSITSLNFEKFNLKEEKEGFELTVDCNNCSLHEHGDTIKEMIHFKATEIS